MMRGTFGIKDISERVKKRFLKFWVGRLCWWTTESVGGFLASLRALHPKREEKEEESDILRREEEVFSKE